MDCDGVREVLSAHYDGQLSQDERNVVAQHLANCTRCAAELADFQRLSMLVRSTPASGAPGLWSGLQTQLEADSVSAFPVWITNRHVPARGAFTVAAVLLIGLLGWWGYSAHRRTAHEQRFAADFSHYLDTFGRDAAGAQQFLLARYQATPVTAREASERMSDHPALRGGLPPQYTVASAYVWEMPCCRCFQLVCRRSDGSTVTIFEHDEPQPGWFVGRQTLADSCGGRACKIVQLDQQLAATWERDGRQVTVIGARSMPEVELLLTSLDTDSSA